MKARLLPALAALVAALTIHAHAAPILRITEVMSSSGSGGTVDWFELRNYGDTAANITGYRMDDNSFSFGLSVALNGVTTIAPGEAAVFIESSGGAAVASFTTFWALSGVQVGYYSGSGVGFSSSGDGAVVFDSGGTEVTPRVNFGAATEGFSFYWGHTATGAAVPTETAKISTVGNLAGQVTYQTATATVNTGSPGTAAVIVPVGITTLYWTANGTQLGGSGTWTVAGANWSTNETTVVGAPWNEGREAFFAGAAGTVTTAVAQSARALTFASDGFELAGAGTVTLDDGVITVGTAAIATVSTPLAGTNGVSKFGEGTLRLAGTNSYAGTTSVVQGKAALGSAGAIPAGSVVTTARFTIFDFEGTSTTVGGLGGVGAFEDLSPELTINVSGGTSARLDGALGGDGDVIIDSDGTGVQRFDSTGQSRSDGLTKNYTGRTVIRRGLLEVDANGYPSVSGVPTETSEVIIEGNATNRGELRLTMDGGTYEFGIDLQDLPFITLAGGTLGNESSETVDLYNPILVTETGSVITSRGAGNGVTTFPGEFYLWGGISGTGDLRKTGAGILFLEGNNSGFSGSWVVANGTLDVPAGVSTGAAPVDLLRTVTTNGVDVGRLRGRGDVGGLLNIAGELDLQAQPGALNVAGDITVFDGGVLRYHFFGEGTPSVRVMATGSFSAQAGAQIAVEGTPAPGTYPVLLSSGGVAGATNITVTGLDGSGLAGAASKDGNTLVLLLTEDSGVTYTSWSGGVPPSDDVNGNGFSALEEFGLGATAPGAPFAAPVQGATNMGGTNYLTLLANIRTNGTGLAVNGQAASSLTAPSPWSTNTVDYIATGATNVPAGCEQRLYRTPRTGARGFLQLRFILD